MLAVVVDERVATVAIEVIHDKVDGLGEGILFDDMPDHASELGAGTIRCRRGEVPPGLWLHDAKYVRGTAPLVLIVLFGWLPRLGWDGIGERTSACSAIGFSSRQTTGWVAS